MRADGGKATRWSSRRPTCSRSRPIGGASDEIRLTERFRPTSNKTIEWSITFDDPTTWARPWTFGMRLTKDESHVFEYACHEGNEGLRGILSAARVAERETGSSK